MLISELPEEIKELALREQERFYKVNKRKGKKYDNLCNAFDWGHSNDGWEMWADIHDGNFTLFYEKYGKQPTEPEMKYFYVVLNIKENDGDTWIEDCLFKRETYPTQKEITYDFNKYGREITIFSLSEISKEWYETLTNNK